MAKIVKLQAENVKRLRAVTIEPKGSVVRISGNNGAGKSSVLDSIAYVLGGEKLCPQEPIRQGEERARAVVQLDNGWTIERRWTPRGTYLEARTAEGATFKKPQALLDDLVGKLSFDPLAFMREEGKKQAETLRKLAGVDLVAFDKKRQQHYDARTLVNRQADQIKARIAALEVDEGAPDEPLSGADLLVEQDRRRQLEAANNRKREDLRRVYQDYQRAQEGARRQSQRVEELERQLKLEREALAGMEADLEARRGAGKALQLEVEALVAPDLEEIPEQLRQLDEVNERVRRKQQRKTLRVELERLEGDARGFTTAIEEVDHQKAEALAAAKFPVEGLAFTADGVTLNGVPFEQASQAEQLRVSMAMAVAMSPKLPIALIRDASLLDERSMALVAELAEKAGAQVWLEVVGKDGAGIVIEDGMVEEAA